MRSPSPIQHHDLTYELNLSLFVSSLKFMHFHQWSNSHTFELNHACENMFMTKKLLHLLHLCTQSNHSQSTPYNDVKQQFTCFVSKMFCCHKSNSKSTFNYKSDTMPLVSVCKKPWMPSYLSLNLTPNIFPQMCYKRLAHAH
jgi:hypothetical protein